MRHSVVTLNPQPAFIENNINELCFVSLRSPQTVTNCLTSLVFTDIYLNAASVTDHQPPAAAVNWVGRH